MKNDKIESNRKNDWFFANVSIFFISKIRLNFENFNIHFNENDASFSIDLMNEIRIT